MKHLKQNNKKERVVRLSFFLPTWHTKKKRGNLYETKKID